MSWEVVDCFDWAGSSAFSLPLVWSYESSVTDSWSSVVASGVADDDDDDGDGERLDIPFHGFECLVTIRGTNANEVDITKSTKSIILVPVSTCRPARAVSILSIRCTHERSDCKLRPSSSCFGRYRSTAVFTTETLPATSTGGLLGGNTARGRDTAAVGRVLDIVLGI